MNVSKEKIAQIRAAARRSAGALGGGAKTTAIVVAAGGAAEMAANYGAEKVDFLKKNWYGKGAALAVIGHLVQKKHREAGIAILGAAGYALSKGYREQPKTSVQVDSKGYDDSSAVISAIDQQNRQLSSLAAQQQMLNARMDAQAFSDEASGDEASGDEASGDAGAYVDASDPFSY